jgi:hypothetical protein
MDTFMTRQPDRATLMELIALQTMRSHRSDSAETSKFKSIQESRDSRAVMVARASGHYRVFPTMSSGGAYDCT